MAQNKARKPAKPHSGAAKKPKLSLMGVATKKKATSPFSAGEQPQQPTKAYELSGARPKAKGAHDGRPVKKTFNGTLLKKIKLRKK